MEARVFQYHDRHDDDNAVTQLLLLYHLKWNKVWLYALLLLFCTVEFHVLHCQCCQNQRTLDVPVFELFIFSTMYVWYYARKINNRFTHFVDLGKYAPQICELSNDENIPKVSSCTSPSQFKTWLKIKSLNPFCQKSQTGWCLLVSSYQPNRTSIYIKVMMFQNWWMIRSSKWTSILVLEFNQGQNCISKIVQELVANKELNLHPTWWLDKIQQRTRF